MAVAVGVGGDERLQHGQNFFLLAARQLGRGLEKLAYRPVKTRLGRASPKSSSTVTPRALAMGIRTSERGIFPERSQ